MNRHRIRSAVPWSDRFLIQWVRSDALRRIAICTLLALMPLWLPAGSAGAVTSPDENIAFNPTQTGFPHPLESDTGWGGGSYPWETLDGKTYHTDTWAHGLAFTGGVPGYVEPCGWRQATVDFGTMKTFDKMRVYHHGDEHIPNTFRVEYWDGSAWRTVDASSALREDLRVPPPGVSGWGAVPTEHVFAPVTGSKARFAFDNCDIEHGWIYELEVYAAAGPIASWTELYPTGAAPPHLHTPKSVFYDGANNRLIAFFPGSPSIHPYGSEVWVIANANGLGGAPEWIKLLPTGTPPRSNGVESVVYDAANNRLTVYGGCAAYCSPALSDVFVLTNANGLGGAPAWIKPTVSNPQARAYHSAVYDADSNRMIAFGGNDAFYNTDHNDTRVLSNANGLASPSTWTTLQTSGGLPGIRNSHTAVYDEAGRNMIVFGGTNYIHTCCPSIQSDYNDTWMLSNADGLSGTPLWTQMMPVGEAPPVRGVHSAVYDPTNDRMIVFGGLQWQQVSQTSLPLGDLWGSPGSHGV